MIWLAVGILALCQALTVVLACRWLSVMVQRKQTDIETRIRDLVQDWTTPPAEGKPHKLAELLSVMGAVVGQAAAGSIMASLSAEKSQVARVANNLSDEIIGQQNPILGLLAGGKRGKGAAVGQLMKLLGGALGNRPAGANGDQGQQSSYLTRFRNT